MYILNTSRPISQYVYMYASMAFLTFFEKISIYTTGILCYTRNREQIMKSNALHNNLRSSCANH